MSRIPVPPATGTCRWLVGEGSVDPESGCQYLQIEVVRADDSVVVQDYEVEHTPGRAGVALHRIDPHTFAIVTHTVTFRSVGDWRCDCPDATHGRLGCCKHVRALRVALSKRPL